MGPLVFERRLFLSKLCKSFIVLSPTVLNIANSTEKKDQGRVVIPGQKLIFPRDFGAHYSYGIEWWYVTGWLRDKSDKEFAYQLTFFRRKTFIGENNLSRFTPKHLVFVHATVISKELGGLRSAQKAGRLGSGLVSCSTKDTALKFENWFMIRQKIPDSYKINVRSKEFSFALKLLPPAKTKNLILRGEAGFSKKGPEDSQASWYYSRPNLDTQGLLEIEGKSIETQGLSWLDHEWSSEFLHPDAVGWDWIGVNLFDGGSLMAFKVRRSDGSILWSDFSMLNADGEKHSLIKKTSNKIETNVENINSTKWVTLKHWTSPKSFATYPVSQNILFENISLKFFPLINNQELDARVTTGGFYWEGAILLSLDEKIIGRGFLELTGYSSPLQMR